MLRYVAHIKHKYCSYLIQLRSITLLHMMHLNILQNSCCVIIFSLIISTALKSVIGSILSGKYIKDNDNLMINEKLIVSNVSTRSALDCITMCVRDSGQSCSYHKNKCNISKKWIGGGTRITTTSAPGAVMFSGRLMNIF